jgi:hypothetical protein
MPAAPVVDVASPVTGAGPASTTASNARFPDIHRGEGPNAAPIWRQPRVAVVIPTNRPTEYDRWFEAWEPYLDGVALYVVRDEPETWQQIDEALSPDGWVIPRQTDCIRSWGFLQAHRDGADVIITMDDDVYPDDPHDAIQEHVRALDTRVEPPNWGRTLPELGTRGLPRVRHVEVNHGLWSGIPDVAGTTQLAGYTTPRLERERLLEPRKHYPLSGMNLSWWRYMTPAMYFGLMGSRPDGQSWGVHRYGDIWAGLMAKRITDHLGGAIRSGTPFVRHQRASDPVKNAQQEHTAEMWTDPLARLVGNTPLPHSLYVHQHARALADALPKLGGDYWLAVSRAWHRWIDWTQGR